MVVSCPTFRTHISNNLIFRHLYIFRAYVKYQLRQMVMNYVRNVGFVSVHTRMTGI